MISRTAATDACHARRPMHAAGIEFHHAVFIGQAAKSHAVVIGIVFRPGDHLHHGIERVAAAGQHGIAAIQIVVAIVRRR